MTTDEEILEAQLLTLGGQERELEKGLLKLRLEMRSARDTGKPKTSERLCSKYEEARTTLSELQSSIVRVENALYGLRRKRTK